MAGRTAVILADGAIPSRSLLDVAWPGWADDVSLVIAADGGARHAVELGLPIDRWVGDGDSIDPGDLAALAASGVAIDRVAAEKDESDAELALQAAIETGARTLVLLGALGGPRVDHAIGNLGLLAHPALQDRTAWLYDEHAARCSLLVAPDAAGNPVERTLGGREGDVVSLVPAGETADGVTTRGLRFPLVDEPLILGRTRGISNVRTAPVATVSLRSGRLLLIETPATVGR
jgi:thiamine pyrophosphokinase